MTTQAVEEIENAGVGQGKVVGTGHLYSFVCGCVGSAWGSTVYRRQS